MRCLIKIPRRYLICLSLSVVFSFCLSVFGFVSDSYATSGSCTVPFNRTSTSNINVSWYNNLNCNIDTYSTWYWRISSISLNFSAPSTLSSGNVFVSFFSATSSQSSPAIALYLTDISYSSSPYTFSKSFSHSRIFTNASVGSSDNYLNYSSPNLYGSAGTSSMRWSGSVVIEYTDDLSVWFSNCEPCPEVTPCPPIPENPYDQKLDDIRKAILTVGAILIMIYFFFIVYKIIVKDGGRR